MSRSGGTTVAESLVTLLGSLASHRRCESDRALQRRLVNEPHDDGEDKGPCDCLRGKHDEPELSF
ncbi:hypothetical protein ACFPRL_22935 [Pseudoclavibacter helvolus]